MKIADYQLLGLFVGGENGTVIQDADAAGTGLEVHMIKIKTDATTFSVLTATDQDGDSFNMLTTNNLTSKEFNTGDLVCAPFGGKITAYTASEDTEQYVMPDTDRNQQ